jgi:hypothetical protein
VALVLPPFFGGETQWAIRLLLVLFCLLRKRYGNRGCKPTFYLLSSPPHNFVLPSIAITRSNVAYSRFMTYLASLMPNKILV